MRQIAVIGLGNFGNAVALELVDQGVQVIGIDSNEGRVEALKDSITYAVTLNAMDESALRSASVHEVDTAVICIGDNVEANLLVTLLLKKIGVRRIWSRAISPLQQEILTALNVDSIINLEQEMGRLVARSLVIQNVIKHIHLSEGCSVAEVKVPEALVGKTLRQSGLRKDYNLNVVAIKRQKPQLTREGERTFEEVTENVPAPDTALNEQDVLVVVGKDNDIVKLTKK